MACVADLLPRALLRHAPAVENRIYVGTAGSVGNLLNVQNMDIHYAQSCILTPCDFPLARDGIAADTTPNSEMIAIADLSLGALRWNRDNGTRAQSARPAP